MSECPLCGAVDSISPQPDDPGVYYCTSCDTELVLLVGHEREPDSGYS